MKRPDLVDFSQERIRTLHFTWIAFFITFYVWFNMAPLATTMLRELGGDGGWLTKDHIKVFEISATFAGLLASSFAVVNLFARPLGGLLSDSLSSRKMVMIGYMVGITVGFLGMSLVVETWPLWLAVGLTVLTSMFVQGAEGATFAIIPMVNRRLTGQVASMAGAYGNVGAVVYLVILSLVEAQTFFLVLAAGAGISVMYCLLFLKEPEGSFEEEYRTGGDVAREGAR